MFADCNRVNAERRGGLKKRVERGSIAEMERAGPSAEYEDAGQK